LKIDGERWAHFTKEEWAKGVNLATLPTPMAKQAAAVHDLTLRHNDVHFARWRLAGSESAQIAIPRRILKAAAVGGAGYVGWMWWSQQRAAALPKSHRYELAAE
jgi:hypothetical protein